MIKRDFSTLHGQLNERQEKALLRMLREGPEGFKGGLSAGNYSTITGAPPATATATSLTWLQRPLWFALANAVTHGDADGPIWVRAHSDEKGFELSVANLGEPIAPEILDHLFQPFSRASIQPGQQGLGLGLYIASEIARAHGGSLAVASSPQETCFTFTMPAEREQKSSG